MLNPWVILIVLLVWAASLVKAWHMGGEHEIGRAAAEAVTRTDRIIRQHNADVVIDMQAAAAAEAHRWAKHVKQLEGRHALELDIERARAAGRGGASCDLDDSALGLLRDSVRRANAGPGAHTPSGSGLRVPTPAGTGERELGGRAPLGR